MGKETRQFGRALALISEAIFSDGRIEGPLLPSLMLLRLLRTCDVSVIPNWAAAPGKTHLLGGKRTLIVKGSLLEKLLSYEDRKSWQSETESKRRERKSSRKNASKKDKEKRQSRKERVTETKSLLTTESQEESLKKEKVAEIKVTETKSLRIIEWQKEKATERQSDRKKVSEKRVTKKKPQTEKKLFWWSVELQKTIWPVVLWSLTGGLGLWQTLVLLSRCRPCWNVHG